MSVWSNVVRVPVIAVAVLAGCLASAGTGRAPDLKPQELLAREVSRLAVMDLRSVGQAGPDDYRTAGTLLSIAHELVPEDPDILRRAIEAEFGANDHERVLELTRELLRIPSESADQIAQLRLITASIARKTQDADDRLRVYETFLSGPEKDKIDPAIRSRLALDAALLLRERGDSAGFLQKLTEAVKLDATHKEAAAVGATYYAERVPEDRVGNLQWLVILMMADPVDPNVHLAMARELASAGAYKTAKRFHTNALNITSAAGEQNENVTVEHRVIQWCLEGPGKAVAQINHELMVAKDDAAREIRRRQESKLSLEGVDKPEDVRLSIPIAAMVILGSEAAGDRQAAEAAMADAVATVQDATLKLRDRVRQGRMPEGDAMIRTNQIQLELQSIRLWTGLQLDQVMELRTRAADFARQFPETFAVLDGWLKVRSGDPEGGIAVLQPVADTAALARLGIATADELLGRKDEAAAEYRRIRREHPLELSGAWARHRLEVLGFSDDPAITAALVKVADTVPDWVDRLVVSPQQFVHLTARISDPSPEAIERTPIEVTLQNLAGVPLGVGADRPISSRLLVTPKLEKGEMTGRLNMPEVVDINRRLRLMPRETITATVWPDPGQSGWLMEAMATRSFQVRWRLIEGFRFDPEGGYQPGPLGVLAETDALVKRPLPEASLSPADLAAKIAGDPVEPMPRLALILRAFLLQSVLQPPAVENPAMRGPAAGAGVAVPEAEPPPPPEAYKAAVDALEARYLSLPAVQRGIFAVVVPHSQLTPVTASFDKLVRNDADPVVRAIFLATRVTSADDEALTRAAQSPDPRLRDLAHSIAARLAGKDALYARMTPADLKPKKGADPVKDIAGAKDAPAAKDKK